ncbi:MAG: hypothetical protein HZA89_11140 [Verrucomicrobia bacterium]|nr:hypothetical protein [Verrucomicrobiota bacterium]
MKLYLLVAAMLLAFTAGSSAQPAVPESPSIWREVTGVTNSVFVGGVGSSPVHTRPHVPAFRTSADGRVGLRVKGSAEFCLMMPEKLTNYALLNPASSYIMSATNYKFLDGYSTSAAHATNFFTNAVGQGNISHCALYDPTPAMNTAGEITNPTAVNGEDVYNLKVLVIYSYASAPARVQIFVTPVQVVVTNAKASNAFIRSITKTGPTVGGPVFTFGDEMFEPVIVGDGRLLVLRVSGAQLPWTDPDTGLPKAAQGTDIAYCYYVDDGTTNTLPANPTKWTNIIPITHAPYDSRINAKFGFAMAPFRDAEGSLIPDGEDLGGTYPWMDRQAKNLFFTAVGDTLHYKIVNGGVTNWDNGRYPQRGTLDETPNYDPALGEDGGNTRGVCFAGLWSHGKIVMIDNLNNDMDYAVWDATFPSGSQRMVELFQPNSGPTGIESGELRLGAGRANNRLPPGDNINTTILDSLENIFNYKPYAVPLTIRDVVWPLSNGKQSDDLVFDDYVDPDAFIVASMAGLVTFDFTATNTTTRKLLIYHSGWNNTTHAFSQPVRLQNAATTTTNRWIVPKHGLMIGNGRLEPVAAGGVYGKGYWMDGSIGLQFSVTNQPQNISTNNWYVGLFVDCRFTNDTTERLLLTFPDRTAISLNGRNQIFYRDANGEVLNKISLPLPKTNAPPTALDDLLPDTGWAHLAFQVRKAGTEVDFYLDGLLYNRWRDLYSSLFQMTPGNLTLGQTNATLTNAFRGWVDDFKVLAHAVDFETACNHAGGTLIGLPAAYAGEWKTNFASRFPTWAHQEISQTLTNNGKTNYPLYASYHDYRTDKGVHRGNIPAGTVSLRQNIHFPEGPLFHNAPRPHSAANTFCTTCHHSSADGGLDLTAITLDSSLTAVQDDRRQPMQPFRRVFGRIPAGLVPTTGLPTVVTNLPAAGKVIDEWTMPVSNAVPVVKSITLVDASTRLDLMQLTNGAVVDPARLGTSNLTFRANLDSAQGSVTLKYDNYANKTKSRPPYTAFGNTNSPYVGSNLVVGAHTIKAWPQSGATSSVSFTVTGSVARVVAGYSNDFKSFSPAPGWSYEWNAAGSITNRANYRFLNWSPVLNLYSANGTPFRPDTNSLFDYGRLTATTANPGQQASLAGGIDRYAIAAYQAKCPGYYGLTNSFVTDIDTSGNGGQILIYTDTAGGYVQKTNLLYAAGTTVNFNLNVGYLQTGDTIYVCFGPNGNDGSDAFNLDFNIMFKETGNPLP